jgi:hypothetical protein
MALHSDYAHIMLFTFFNYILSVMRYTVKDVLFDLKGGPANHAMVEKGRTEQQSKGF